jgi:hypothetical protein
MLLLGIWLAIFVFNPSSVSAQSVPEASKPVCAYCGATLPSGTHSSSCPYYAPGSKAKVPKHKHGHGSDDINAMVVGTLFETLLTAMFADNAASEQEALAASQKAAEIAHQQEALKRAKEAREQAEFEKMMQSYKLLEDSQSVGFKTLSASDLDFKTLDGETEKLASEARRPFDSEPKMKAPGSEGASGVAPFFGDRMPIEQIQLLVHPENDPNVVDLRNARNYVVDNFKKDGQRTTSAAKPTPADAERPTEEACAILFKKLDGFLTQRTKFQKTIDLAQEQLTTWQNANRNALLNTAKDGLEYFSGQLLEDLTERGKAADRLQQIYEKNAGQMAQDGLDTAAIAAKIKRLKELSSTGRISELTSNVKDWQSFIKNGVSALMLQLNASNQEIQGMLEDPRMQKYFEMDAPQLKALLDISRIAASAAVFGKWVANKMPIIGGVELAINQSYNALDWYLSYKRIKEAHAINGRVLEAVRLNQQNINQIKAELGSCY